MPFIDKTVNLHNHLTLARSRPVNCHVIIPLDIGHFLLVVLRTRPLSPAFLEIFDPKDNWVTTLTFLGHVTSSVTWPFDSPYPTSYLCSIVTKPLSPALFISSYACDYRRGRYWTTLSVFIAKSRRLKLSLQFSPQQWRIQLWAVGAAAPPPIGQKLGLVMAARLRHGGKFSLKSLIFAISATFFA